MRAMKATELLKARRIELGLSQYAVAIKAGVRENDVSRWERGTVTSLPLLGTWRLCRALGLDLEDVARALDEEETR